MFLGYSPLHKGYRSLHLFIGRVYISHDVVVDEGVFPFAAQPHLLGPRWLDEHVFLLPSLPPNLPSNSDNGGDNMWNVPNEPNESLESSRVLPLQIRSLPWQKSSLPRQPASLPW